MATVLKIGETLPLSIAYFDQNGSPMDPVPAADAPPAWANIDPAIDLLTAAPDGNSATAKGLGVGTDTIQVSLSVGGVSFSATLDVTVEAGVPLQTLTSIQIVAGVPSV